MLNAVIEVTSKCSNRCLWCSSNAGPKENIYMPVRMFTAAVKDLYAMGAQALCISGGEPFLHPEINTLLSRALKAGFSDVQVYTSGVSRKHSAVVLPESMKNSVSLVFGVASFNQAMYDLLTCTENHFKALVQSMESCQNCEVHFLPTKLTLAELYTLNLEKLERAYHIRKFRILRHVWHGWAAENKESLYITEESILLAAQVLHTKYPSIPVKLSHPYAYDGECTAGTSKLVIDVTGNVYPCEAFKHTSPVGNISTDTLTDIYQKACSWKESCTSGLPCTSK